MKTSLKVMQVVSALSMVLLAMFLPACGGENRGPDNPWPEVEEGPVVKEGVYVDSPVEGLTYETVTHSGTTDTKGRFNYEQGETITFSIGDLVLGLVLGQGTARERMSPIDLVPGATDEKHPTVTNICRLIQSLDEDGNLFNGIKITPVIAGEVERRSIDFTVSTSDFGNSPDVQDLFDTLNDLGAFSDGAPRTLRSAEQAQNHLAATLKGLYDTDDDADGYTEYQGDCDDNDNSIHPGPTEICGDGKDNDCDGAVDEGCTGLDTYTNSLGMTFNLIPAGTFIMGSPKDPPEPGRGSDEVQHQVTLSNSYYMQTTEVTQAQWEAVMGSNPSYFSGCPDCPVEWVTWETVQEEFITALNDAMGEGTYRLPTEAEWEYAARAGSDTAFANGDITETLCGYDPNLDKMGWYCYNSGDYTHIVSRKDPNAWGLDDMHGNVREWCEDWYGRYPSEPVTDPTGPASHMEENRVIRGGGFDNYAMDCRSAYRDRDGPYNDVPGPSRFRNLGFRLAWTP
jgi:formylglycine-generating enzyme required for sulfatase activity